MSCQPLLPEDYLPLKRLASPRAGLALEASVAPEVRGAVEATVAPEVRVDGAITFNINTVIPFHSDEQSLQNTILWFASTKKDILIWLA